jgi:D-inositol-3-phosphate glycosyltransferase
MGEMKDPARSAVPGSPDQDGAQHVPRVAVISVHTSPLDQPGTGDSGGMNVYIAEVAGHLAEQGIAVDIYTRCHGGGGPEVQPLGPGTRLIQVQAGPCQPVPKDDLPGHLPQFLHGVLRHAAAEEGPGPHRHSLYDVVHSHYWLSGWVGSRAKQIWGAPHVASFHTLGKVKNESLGVGDRPEPRVRLHGEQHVIKGADRILAPTPVEAADLVDFYGADPNRIRIVPPGVDRTIFVPQAKDQARARLHLSNDRLLLFVGRLQPYKGPDVAIRALAHAVAVAPEATADWILGVVGGPATQTPGADEVARLMGLASACGVGDRVVFFPPQPHDRLAEFYSAAEVVLMPSRSESFGLVALEAQSCGTPVIAAAAGGLRYVVREGETGFLVKGHDPAHYAERMLTLLGDPGLAARLSHAAMAHAARFSWDTTATGVGRVYRELLGPPR